MQNTETIPIYDSARRGLPAIEELRELFRYRNLILQTIRRNLVIRYKRSVLGIAWTMLNPLGTTLILTFVFSNVFGGASQYAPYVLSGLLCWTFFSQTTSDSMANLIWGEGLLRRIYVPRTVFAVSAIGTGLINLAIGLVPLLLVMLFTGMIPQTCALLLPIPTLFLAMFSLGVGLLISTVAVYFADMVSMYGIALTAWMYISPVIYKIDRLPQEYIWIIKLNPMYYLINLFREPIYYSQVPTLREFFVAGVIATITLVVGWWVFTAKSDEFAYRV
jgi:homopolymeric O-antigen transport system permease protein